MPINERIKSIRTALNLTQTEFGNKIGLKQNTVGQIENGQRSVTERTIMLICQTYNVSEQWLNAGKGEMFVENDESTINQLAEEYKLDMLDRKIIETYLNLSEPQRNVFKDFARSLVDAVLDDENYEEYRGGYIKENALPIAARHGDVSGLQEAVDAFENADGDEKKD